MRLIRSCSPGTLGAAEESRQGSDLGRTSDFRSTCGPDILGGAEESRHGSDLGRTFAFRSRDCPSGEVGAHRRLLRSVFPESLLRDSS